MPSGNVGSRPPGEFAMPYVKPDGTIVYGNGQPDSRLTPEEMAYRDKWNRWTSLPSDVRSTVPPPPRAYDPKAGLMQEYMDAETERRIAGRLKARGALDGLMGEGGR